MTHGQFVQNIIFQFGDWKANKKLGISQKMADFRKEQFTKKLGEMYMEDDLQGLWDRVLVECKFKPTINVLNSIVPGRVLVNKHLTGFVRSSFGLENEYTTETGKFLGRGLADFMKPHKMDSKGSFHEMTESDEQELIARTILFWDKLASGMQKVPQRIKEKVFYPERCKGCGRRIGKEREKEEAYCDGCGTNILDPLNIMRDIGEDQVGLSLAEKIKPEKGVRELRI